MDPASGTIVQTIPLPAGYTFSGGDWIFTVLVRPSDHVIFLNAHGLSGPAVLVLDPNGGLVATHTKTDPTVCCIQQMAFDPLDATHSTILAGVPFVTEVWAINPFAGTEVARVSEATGNFIGMNTTADNRILVGDWWIAKVFAYKANGTALGLFADPGADTGRDLWGIAEDQEGGIYFASDTAILKYDSAGTYLGTSLNPNFAGVGVYFNPTNRLLYVPNADNNKVVVLNTSLQEQDVIDMGAVHVGVPGLVPPSAACSLTQITDSALSVDSYPPSTNAVGMRLAFHWTADPLGTNGDLNDEIFLLDLQTSTLSQITSTTSVPDLTCIGSGDCISPAISAHGTRVAFSSARNPLGTNGDQSMEVFLANCDVPMFADGFESSNTSAWSMAVP